MVNFLSYKRTRAHRTVSGTASNSTQTKNNVQKIYKPFGFDKGYNFVLWFVFAGALFGFCLARLMYLSVDGVFCGPGYGPNHATPGECYYYQNFNRYAVGIRLHLYTILPAGLLVVFQFVPAIRHKAILFHRINGYVVVLLALSTNAGAMMIARHAFGGHLETQALIGTLFISTIVGLALAYYNIKRLQIDQHRAWMIRTWFYFASIITLRIIMILSATIVSQMGGYYSAQPCVKMLSALGNSTELVEQYPTCAAFTVHGDQTAQAVVKADFPAGGALGTMAALNESFGMAGWLALALHAIGVEIYLHLTPREAQRLRDVSYHRQLEAGHKRPGNSGLTPQRLGDAVPLYSNVGSEECQSTLDD